MTDYMQKARELTEAEPLQNSDWSLERVYRRVLARTLEALDNERAAHEATKAELQIARAMQHAYALDKKEAEVELQALREALGKIAADAFVSLDQLPPHDMPNGWRKIAVERIDIARQALTRKDA